MKRACSCSPFVLCAAALAACGSDGSKTVVQTVTTSAPTPGPSVTITTVQRVPHAQPPRRTRPTVSLAFFRSPTGNIGCAIAEGTARCDIRDRSWSPPPRPASCSGDTDYGQGLIVGTTGRARFVCAGDTALNPSGRALSYGTDSQVDGFTCESRVDGVTCRHNSTGHGFLVNRERYRIF